MNKGVITDVFSYQPIKIKGAEFKDLATKKIASLQAKSAYIQGQMSAILSNQRVMPNKPVEKWRFDYDSIPKQFQYSYELVEFSNNKESSPYNYATESVECSPLRVNSPEYSYKQEDCCVSESECAERCLYNNLVYEFVSLQNDIVTLDIMLTTLDESKTVELNTRTYGALKV